MKKTLFYFVLVLVFILGSINLQAQTFNYSTRTGTLGTTYSWVDCSSGSNIVTGDDARTTVSWPFSFRFFDSNYTTANSLSVCTNGFIRLNGNATTTASTATNFTLSSGSTELGQVIALGTYDAGLIDGGSWVRSNLSGTSPYRVFTIEYNNLEIDYNDNKYADIQVSFYETLNRVVVKLGAKNITKSGADIGIHSGTSGYFHKWQEVLSGTENTWIEYTFPVEVNATTGTELQYYPTLKTAFDAINSGTHTGTITTKIGSSTAETVSPVLNASGSGSASYASVLVYPKVAGVSITGTLNSNFIQLNGADNVTIDGRVNQAGSADMLISNLSTGASARTIEIQGSAETNYIQYCNIKGAGSSLALGTITLGGSTSGNGNDGNYIQYNNLTSVSSTNRPANLIYAAGASGYVNDQNYIRNNNLYDFLLTGSESYALNVSSFCSGFSITGNSFYQTASFVPTASVSHGIIRVNNTSANDFIISGNYLGGNAASASGTWTKTNAFNNEFTALYFNGGSTNNSIQDNTIKGFTYSNSGAANWYGIYMAGGVANIGTSTGNKIGEDTGTGSITFTGGATNASFYGIYSATTGNMQISNNIIGSITVAASSTANATNFYGIHKTATSGSITISKNIIGSEATANSVQTSSTATGTSQILYGIYNLGTGSISISDNTLANLANSTTETTLASRTRGIFSNDGSNTISGNKVFKISTVGLSNGVNYSGASIVGISLISNTSGNAQTISNNKVYNIETTATGKIELYGIFYDGPDAVEAVISRNFVHTFVVPAYPSGSTGSYLHGISLFDGSYIASNNIVYLGEDINIGCSIWGIWTGTNDAAKIYHNTIYLTGEAQSGTSNSFAFRSLFCPSSLDVRNNILWDGRTNVSGTISHYAVYLNCITNVTMDYNDYRYEQDFGIASGTTYSDFTTWKSGTGYDTNSTVVDPSLVNRGGLLPVDYQTTVQLVGTSLAAVTTDFDNISRVTPTMGAWEFFQYPVEVWINGSFVEDYERLKLAFDAINSGTHQGDLTIKFRGNTIETEKAVLNASGTGAANYSHVIIYPARSGVTVTGNLNEPIVELNGADNVTFDGRIEGSGDAYEFSFLNNSTSATAGTSTFRFVNTTQNDTIRYCVVKGGATGSATGNIILGSATASAGNNNNVIHYNKITSLSDTNRPVNAIYSAGTSGLANTGNKISSNSIYDFLNKSNNSYGVNIQAYSSATTISGNSFYETTSFAPTSGVEYRLINIDDTSGNAHVISSNYMGGNEANAIGTWTKTNAASNVFYGMYVNAGTTTASTIDGNIIRNFSYSNSANSNWYAVKIAGGKVDAGLSSGNTIGAATGNGSITVTNSTSGGTIYGFDITSTSDVQCQNNTIGSITAANSNAANATNFVGFNKSTVGGNAIISKNTVGSTETSNSIQTTSTSTGSAQTLYGINSDGTAAFTANENTIANLTNATTNTTAATRGRINGIVVSAGTSNTIQQNLVRNLTIANANTSNNYEMSVVGINLINTVENRTISDNQIYNLSNTYASYAGYISGIYYRGATTGTNAVFRNFVHSITATNAAASLIGIIAASGNTTYSNNIIVLGNATNNVIYGLYDLNSAGQTCNAYFNTVYIGGATTGTNYSYAMYSATALGTRNYRNNIFNNRRTTSSGTYHAAIGYVPGSNTGLTVDYNNYYVTGTGTTVGLWGGATRTLSTLRTSTGGDVNSNTTNPTFVVAGSTTATDYKVGVTLTGIAGTGITNDYGLFSRPGTAPTMGAWERNVNRWKGTNSTDWGTASNWTGNTVPATDETIEFDPVPVRHCIMDVNRSVMHIINAQGTYRVVTNGKTLTIKGDLQFTNGAQIDASATSSKISMAGTATQTIPAGSLYNNEVYNLEVNNINNVSLNGTVRLLNQITSVSGRFDAYTNNTLMEYAGSALQTIESGVYLDDKAHNITSDNTTGVQLNADFTLNNNLVVNASRKFIIQPAKTLTVSGTVTNSAGVDGILIKASSTDSNGSLIFFNSEANAVAASVEMFSRSTWNLDQPTGSKYNWQFFGIPVRTMDVLPTFTGGYVRKKLETGTTTANHWQYLTNESVMEPFYGYELCFQTQRTLTFSGELVNRNFNSGTLAKTSGAIYPGQHLFANPYTAGIDIRQIEFGSDMEATIYLYNTGSYNQWSVSDTKIGATPGQYISIPKNLAGYSGIPRQVPSMSSMLTRVITSTSNAYVNIPYSSVAMGNSEMQRAPKKNTATLNEETLISCNISVDGATNGDKMWVFVSDIFTRTYDNGYDGRKMTPAVGMARLFSPESDYNYNINAVDDMNNTILAFRAGVDSMYTFTINHKNTELKYESLYLHDTSIDSLVNITESGTQYTFKAKNYSVTENRFRIVANANSGGLTTETINIYENDGRINLKSIAEEGASVRITDISGRLIYQTIVDANGLKSLPVEPHSVYLITVISKGTTKTHKMVMK